jgi:hypothetical protein
VSSPSAVLLGAIVALTVAELAAVLVIALYGPRDQTTTLLAVLIGIVGPTLASLVAVVTSAAAHTRAGVAEGKADQAQASADDAQASADDAQASVSSST